MSDAVGTNCNVNPVQTSFMPTSTTIFIPPPLFDVLSDKEKDKEKEKDKSDKEKDKSDKEKDKSCNCLSSNPGFCPSCPEPAPCPACARCPEPAFECQKVPSYGTTNSEYLPKPVLADFSQFGR